MKYKTKILVSPFGHSYWLGENHIHDEETFYKTWQVIYSGRRYVAQSLSNSKIWELEVFDDDLHPIDPPQMHCQHNFVHTKTSVYPLTKDDCTNETYGGFSIVIHDCSLCRLHKSEMVYHDLSTVHIR